MAVLSTDSVAPPDRFDYWREVITRRFVALRPERVDDGEFFGEIEPVAIGALAATRLRTVAQRVHRGPREIAASPADVLFLNLQVRGTSSVHQDGDEEVLRPGDFSIVDAARPFELGVGGPLEHVSVALPRERLACEIPSRAAVCGRAIDGGRGAGRLVSSLLAALASGGPFEAEARSVAELHLVELLGVALRESFGSRLASAPGTAARAARHAAALRFIARNASRPELAPRDVAAHLRVSLRYLQLLFADRGDSVGRRILRTRLELARQTLASPAARDLDVTEVALRSGFRDPSHFSRSFRRHFGVSPRDWRRDPRPPLAPSGTAATSRRG